MAMPSKTGSRRNRPWLYFLQLVPLLSLASSDLISLTPPFNFYCTSLSDLHNALSSEPSSIRYSLVCTDTIGILSHRNTIGSILQVK